MSGNEPEDQDPSSIASGFRHWWNMRGCYERPPRVLQPEPPPSDPALPSGFFGRMGRAWQEARGNRLRAEYEDTCRRVAIMPDLDVLAVRQTLGDLAREFAQTRGHPLEILQEDRGRLARHYERIGKRLYYLDMPRAYGHTIFAAFLEATTLPGSDAAWVKERALETIKAASEREKNG